MWCVCIYFFFSSIRRHTRCSLVTGVQTCSLPIYALCTVHWYWSWLFGRARHAVAARMPYRIWGVDAVSSGVFLLGPQADGVDRHPHYLAMISRQTLEEQLVHPDYGDPAMPIDIPPSLRGARPVVASLVREVAS